MKRFFIDSEYALPAEEFASPPEQPETLQDKRRYPGAPGTPPEPKADSGDPVNPTISAAAEEAAAAEKASEIGQTAARQARKKRSLLLQIAAVASSVVLVSNSFGLDFLGLDGLFNDSVIIGQVEAETKPVTPSAYALPGLPLGGDTEFPELTDTEPKLADYNGHPYDIWIAEGTFEQAPDGGWGSTIHRFPYLDERSGGDLVGPMATFFDRDGNPLEFRGSDDTIWYDASTNTLTLHDYNGEFLQSHRMPEGFTIRLEGVSTLSQFLFADGCSIRLTGDGTLYTNQQNRYPFGVLIRAAYSDACLMIEPEVDFSFQGSQCAVRVEATSAGKAVWLKDETGFSNIRQVTFTWEDSKDGIDPEKDSDSLHYYTWSLVDRTSGTLTTGIGRRTDAPEPPQTEPATETPTGPVITPPDDTLPVETTAEETLPDETTTEVPTEPVLAGEPIGGDAAFPILPDPLPAAYSDENGPHMGSFILSDGDGGYWTLNTDGSIYPADRDDILYDKAANTLILNNCTAERLQINEMGTGFTIRLVGKNVLSEALEVFGNGREAVAVTLSGSGYLSLNASGTNEAGLHIWGFGQAACVMIGDGVTLDIVGARTAVMVNGTTTAKAIYYSHAEELAGVRQEIFSRSSYSSGDSFAYDWITVSEEGLPVTSVHLGGEVPPDPELPGLPVGGDAEFPVLPNLMPNTPVPGYGVLNEDYIQLFDRTTDVWEFLYLNPAWTNDRVSPAGISYDPETNTLTLNNYHGKGISANLLGNGFTVELIGENELEQDFMVWGFYTGGSITFTGTGSLIINSSFTQEVGLELICEASESCVMIDSGVTLDIYGKTNAVNVLDTSAEKAIYYLSGKPVRNVRQVVGTEETVDGVVYRQWILSGNRKGSDVTHLHIEGNATNP